MEQPKPRCAHMATCELFPKFSLKASLQVWILMYCEGRFEECARYKLSLTGQTVPVNLLPNGRELDLAILGR